MDGIEVVAGVDREDHLDEPSIGVPVYGEENRVAFLIMPVSSQNTGCTYPFIPRLDLAVAELFAPVPP